MATIEFDIFISHASEDKDALVRPLAAQLRSHGLSIWFDETELRLGDSLRRSIDRGLSKSRYGLVILSPDFLKKEWPQKELDGLVAREDGAAKIILPIWHNLTRDEIAAYSAPLADKLAAATSRGLQYVVEQILRVVVPTESGTTNFLPPKSESISYEIHGLVIELLDRVVEQADSEHWSITGVPTGFYDLDRCTSGFQPASLIILGGRPSMGKTALALDIAAHVSCNERLPTSIFSQIDSADQITRRLVGGLGRIDPTNLRDGSLTEDEWPTLTDAIERLRHAQVHINDVSDLSIENFQKECRRLVSLNGALGLIVIDTLQSLTHASGGSETPESICRKLKNLAKELHCPILVLSDLPRNIETRLDKRPVIGDLADIDGHADLILFLYRNYLYNDADTSEAELAEVIVAKQRNGSPTGTVRLAFNRRIGKFESLALSMPNSAGTLE